MSEDFDLSQDETGFPLLKWGNFASFAPVNKCWFSRDWHILTGAYATPMLYVIRQNSILLWTRVQQIAEARHYHL